MPNFGRKNTAKQAASLEAGCSAVSVRKKSNRHDLHRIPQTAVCTKGYFECGAANRGESPHQLLTCAQYSVLDYNHRI